MTTTTDTKLEPKTGKPEMLEHLLEVLSGRCGPAFEVNEIPYIVRAVNAHDDLVRAIKALMSMEHRLPDGWHLDEDGQVTTEESETDRILEIEERVKVALLKAEGR